MVDFEEMSKKNILLPYTVKFFKARAEDSDFLNSQPWLSPWDLFAPFPPHLFGY